MTRAIRTHRIGRPEVLVGIDGSAGVKPGVL